MTVRYGAAVFLLVVLSSAGVVSATDAVIPTADEAERMMRQDVAVRQKLEARMAELGRDAKRVAAAMSQGEVRSELCKVCHGADGNSVREGTPSLAGQNAAYLIEQFQRYADHRRYDYWMSSLSETLGDEDKLQLAVFYSRNRMVPSRGGDPALLERGGEIYRTYCTECHGPDGRGREGYARLAGQRPEYTLKMLKEFRTAGGKRYNPWMYGRANMLQDERDMLAVATYLAHLE